MPYPNLLVVAVDGLRASALGAYGNTSFPTPAFDQLAADSLLFDNCFAPAAELADNYRALWSSRHPARGAHESISASPCLPSVLTKLGYHTTLIADDPAVAKFPGASDFDVHAPVVGMADPLPLKRADVIAHTELARVFAVANELVERAKERDNSRVGQTSAPQCVWLHVCGMYGAWDAPLDLQQSLLDDEDPPPLESVSSPDLVIAAADDPDAAFRHTCAYSAQVMALDACWSGLWDALTSASAPWLVVLIGTRGFPLGEHGRVGGIDHRLYVEQLHVPWLMRFPDRRYQLSRNDRLVSHLDLLPTLLGVLKTYGSTDAVICDGENVVGEGVETVREALLATSGVQSSAFRTASFCLREALETVEEHGSANARPTTELFVRPDDRWEANDVSKLLPDVVEELHNAAADVRRSLLQGGPLSPDRSSASQPGGAAC